MKKQSAPESNNSDVETTPAPKKRRGRPEGGKKKKKKMEEEELPPPTAVVDPPQNDLSLDEGDPPWRTSGHEYLSRRIQWTIPLEEAGAVASRLCVGTVVAWIADTDVDSEGNPGFTCSKTGKPAKLFHAIFEEFEQDLEEWELEESFAD